MSDERFLKTNSILDKILAHKVIEIQERQKKAPLATVREMATRVSSPQDFVAALRRDSVALIAEVKKASPSKGILIEDFDHLKLAQIYADNGAAAISVLTDEQFFQGHLAYLEAISHHVNVPLLRKDFIIDVYQVYEARMARASAVLLIVACLSDSQLRDLYAAITELKMAALIEVHNELELERALQLGAELIGINNRNLKTFDVDLQTTQRLAKRVPGNVTLVAESGLKSADDVTKMGQMGAHAVLVGTGLVTSTDIARTVREFSNC